MSVKEVLVSITSKGQITLPVEVLRRLGLRPHDKVSFAIDTETNEVQLRPVTFTLEEVFGSVAPPTETAELSPINRQVWDDNFDEEVEKG
jgi:bifunctional DNA-binding transcriptional regulator/antitoxin component of YhaV-PrlF toxin-antitoxin module